MAEELTAGANAPLTSDIVPVRATGDHGRSVDFAVAVLPGSRGVAPWFPSQEPPPYYAERATSGVELVLNLSRFSNEVETVHLVAYACSADTTLKALRGMTIEVDGFTVRLGQDDLVVQCVVFAELYKRAGKWKIRARKDGVFDGIKELGRRLGVSVPDLKSHETSLGHTPLPSDPGEAPRGGMPDWTGSGSMVADRFLVTNAHVVTNAREIRVSAYSGRTRAEPVIVDETNDLALLRLSESFGPTKVVFRDGGVHLGEHAHAIGYPLSGLLGRGPQFTSGSVSNLLGPGDDARLMQVTCPIQPGSSGGPVFDDGGNMIAVVTATLSNAQNVNFAIRSALVLPLLDAASITYQRRNKGEGLPVSEIVRANSPSVWRVECLR
ncbi:trypsin-like peptidase [Rhizobium sp. PP-F2F-G20b]|nr:trypsin-like peptidase [Rhizobium sp. PP-F2F-G20b]